MNYLQQVAPELEAQNCGFVDWMVLETVGNGIAVNVALA